MQRTILHGVPYFTDSQNRLYLWDTEAAPVCIGSYNPESQHITYDNATLSLLGNRLQVWRQNQHARPRKSTASASKRRGNRGDGAAESADASDDE
jgi:hypothetical protein